MAKTVTRDNGVSSTVALIISVLLICDATESLSSIQWFYATPRTLVTRHALLYDWTFTICQLQWRLKWEQSLTSLEKFPAQRAFGKNWRRFHRITTSGKAILTRTLPPNSIQTLNIHVKLLQVWWCIFGGGLNVRFYTYFWQRAQSDCSAIVDSSPRILVDNENV